MRNPFESQTTETPPMLMLREFSMEADVERTSRANPTFSRRSNVGVSATFGFLPLAFSVTRTPSWSEYKELDAPIVVSSLTQTGDSNYIESTSHACQIELREYFHAHEFISEIRVSLLLLAAFALPASGFAQAGSTPAAQVASPEKVIFDTDIGDDIDDVFALGIALASPELKIVGITSAWGDTALRARMIDRVLCETGRSDIPVLIGVATHRADAAEFSQAPWAKAGLPHRPHGNDDAVAFILDQARLHPGEITLIAVAPLTNIGAAIDRDPATFRKLKRVVLMGGSVLRGYDAENAPGVPTQPMAEYNIAMDPPAAQKLFHSGVPVYMMPLDSTQIAFDTPRSAEFAAISTPLTDSIEVLTAEWSHVTKRSAPTLFDPVAVAYTIDAATCPTTPVHIEVDAKGFTRSSEGTPNAKACLKAQPEAFFSLAMPRLTQQRLAGTKVCVAK